MFFFTNVTNLLCSLTSLVSPTNPSCLPHKATSPPFPARQPLITLIILGPLIALITLITLITQTLQIKPL